jgi:hypothetical protein
MEELLRAYARKRREQAEPGVELHPATRKLLLDEVKSTFAATPAPTRPNWRAWRWPLLAMWAGMAALLVMFAMINMQLRSLAPSTKDEGTRKKDFAARDGRAPQQIAGANTLTPTAPAAPPATTAEDLDKVNSVPAASAEVAERAVPPVPLTVNAPAGQLGSPVAGVALSAAPPPRSSTEQVFTMPTVVAKASARAPARFYPAPAEAAPPVAANDGSEVAAGNFVQVPAGAREGAAPPPPNLLSNFRMLRSGQNVSVVDADGSVYNGQVLDASKLGYKFGGAGGAQKKAQALKDANEESNWDFNVTGVNNSLKQHIVFTGNVLAMPAAGAISNAAPQNRNASQFQNASKTAQQAPGAQNSRIKGKVQVGGGKPFDIEAKPPAQDQSHP